MLFFIYESGKFIFESIASSRAQPALLPAYLPRFSRGGWFFGGEHVPFTKLDSGIINSSVWSLPSDERVVWITLLAMADDVGFVSTSFAGLVRAAVVSAESAKAALKKFESPDNDSRTAANDGKRVLRVEGGWLILNYELYRARTDRDYLREKMKKYRAGCSDTVSACSATVALPSASASSSSASSSSALLLEKQQSKKEATGGKSEFSALIPPSPPPPPPPPGPPAPGPGPPSPSGKKERITFWDHTLPDASNTWTIKSKLRQGLDDEGYVAAVTAWASAASASGGWDTAYASFFTYLKPEEMNLEISSATLWLKTHTDNRKHDLRKFFFNWLNRAIRQRKEKNV